MKVKELIDHLQALPPECMDYDIGATYDAGCTWGDILGVEMLVGDKVPRVWYVYDNHPMIRLDVT